MTERKQWNSTLRPHSPKRMKALQSGDHKPKPRKPLKAKRRPARDDKDPYPPKRYTLRLAPNATGTFSTPKPSKRTLGILKDVIRLAMEKEGGLLKKAQPSARQKLDDELIAVHSEYVRRRVADHRGFIACFICGKELHWKHAHNMHFMGRSEYGTRFDDVGCQAGCPTCNGKPNGDRPRFGRRLDARYGPGTADALRIKAKQVMHYDRAWYRERLAHYRELLSKLP